MRNSTENWKLRIRTSTDQKINQNLKHLEHASIVGFSSGFDPGENCTSSLSRQDHRVHHRRDRRTLPHMHVGVGEQRDHFRSFLFCVSQSGWVERDGVSKEEVKRVRGEARDDDGEEHVSRQECVHKHASTDQTQHQKHTLKSRERGPRLRDKYLRRRESRMKFERDGRTPGRR